MTTMRRRLLWTMLPAMGALLIAAGIGIYVAIRSAIETSTDAMLKSKAIAVAAIARSDGDGVAIETTSRILRDFEAPDPADADHEHHDEGDHDEGDTAYFEIWNQQHVSLTRSASLVSAHLSFRSATDDGDEADGWNTRLPSGRPGRAVSLQFTPLPMKGAPAIRTSAVWIVVAIDRHEIDVTLSTVAWVLAGAGGVLLLAMTLVVPTALRRGLAPLDTLASQASDITATSLSTRFAVTGMPGELAPITARLNELLARLESSFERERQFSSDLAHELRTPIAELRSIAEVAIKWPDARPPETDRESLAIASQLDGIVGRLLALLRSERGQLLVERQHVYLEAEIDRACHAVTARAETRRIRIERPVDHLQVAQVDVVLLRSILANLLDNAVDYSPEGGTVQIECVSKSDGFRLRVSNDAGDLRAEDVSKLFDRFWRGSASRSDHEHSGLGLSLAKAFAEAMGCRLTATLENSRITLELASNTIDP